MQKTSTHEEVSRAYTRAVSEPGSGCCGGETPEQKGVVVKSAGYEADDLAALPQDAVVNSFGCGNPLAFSGVQEGDVVLDLGSGAGIDLLLASRKVGPTGWVIGVDMTDAMIERARQNIERAGSPNVEVRKGLIEAMPVADASVDWVISNCVINLSPDKPAVFREIARVLKPGGRMRVSDILVEDLPEVVRHDKALYCSCVAGAIPETEYLAGLEAAGLEEVEVAGRIVYDADQLEAFVRSELPGEKSGCCATGASSTSDVVAIARAMEGKVCSATVTARKRQPEAETPLAELALLTGAELTKEVSVKKYIFACVHNAGRSQMAAAWFNAVVDKDKAVGVSAGTAPGERVHPEVVSVMQEMGVDLSASRPQRLTSELAAGAVALVTMGCGEACPYIPGLRVIDWPLTDPKGQPIEEVRRIRDDIRKRVERFVLEERLDARSST